MVAITCNILQRLKSILGVICNLITRQYSIISNGCFTCRLLRQYKGHDFEIIVDNARTHSAKEFSLNDFGRKIGTRCRVDSIEFVDVDDGQTKRLFSFFTSGEHSGKSKGLFILAKELNLKVDDKIKT